MGTSTTITGSAATADTSATYAAASDVAALCRNLLGGAPTFSTTTCPKLVEVENWLSSGCSVIESRLSSWGYTIPVASTTTLYAWLRDLNAFYAAANAEWARSNVILAPGERSRGMIFERR